MNKSLFEQSFPSTASCSVEVTKTGKGVAHWNKTTVFDEATYVRYVKCSNPECKDGIYIYPILLEAIQQGETELEKTVICPGLERRGVVCSNTFHIKATIIPKERA
jgi:hypothetical protein